MNLDNYNYWNDGRVIASMVDLGTYKDGKIVVGELTLETCFDVCPQCAGHGKMVNPSIDAGGLTGMDPDFAQDYFSGAYDVRCSMCKGERVVPVVDERRNSAEDVQAYKDHVETEWAYAREVAAERRMGA